MRSHGIALLVMLLLVGLLIGGITALRYQAFADQHQAIAREAVRGITAELARLIGEQERLVGVFTQDHQPLLGALVRAPDDPDRYLALSRQVVRYFPDASTYAIANPQGELVVHDLDFLVGELCLQDIREFDAAGQQRQRVHPSVDVHHFDLLGEFRVDGRDYILLVSFNARILGDLLGHMQTPDHERLLVLAGDEALIEATAAGSRRDFVRDDYRLTDEEAARVLARDKVPGTRWEILSLHTPRLFTTMRNRLLVEGLLVFGIFALLAGVMRHFLNRAQGQRDRAERLKDEFLAVVSHELRTPITSMLGSLGLMVNGVAGDLPPRARELSRLALANGERLLGLVNDILDIQRIEAGQLAIERRPVALGRLVCESLEHNRAYAERFGAAFQLEDLAPGVVVQADPQRLSQVLDNLLSNAVKYGREGDRIEVVITADDDHACVAIRDHGNGVSPALAERIFEKFTQGDTSPRRRRDGTGLGLFIARTLVEQHDGRLGFDSAPGRGSCFWFELPLARPAARQSAAGPLD